MLGQQLWKEAKFIIALAIDKVVVEEDLEATSGKGEVMMAVGPCMKEFLS